MWVCLSMQVHVYVNCTHKQVWEDKYEKDVGVSVLGGVCMHVCALFSGVEKGTGTEYFGQFIKGNESREAPFSC